MNDTREYSIWNRPLSVLLRGRIGHELEERRRSLIICLRPLLGRDGNDVIDIQQQVVAFHQNLELEISLVGKEGRAVGQSITSLLGGDRQALSHALTGFEIPGRFCRRRDY